MQVHIKYTNLDSSAALTEYANQKLSRLDKLTRKIDPEGHGFIYLEIARTTRHHHKGEVYAADANLHLPRKMIRASTRSADVRKMVDELADTLYMEVGRYKETLEARRRASRE